jgi:hypothetical protein
MIKSIIITILFLWYVDINLTWLEYFGIKDVTVVLTYYFSEPINLLNRMI